MSDENTTCFHVHNDVAFLFCRVSQQHTRRGCVAEFLTFLFRYAGVRFTTNDPKVIDVRFPSRPDFMRSRALILARPETVSDMRRGSHGVLPNPRRKVVVFEDRPCCLDQRAILSFGDSILFGTVWDGRQQSRLASLRLVSFEMNSPPLSQQILATVYDIWVLMWAIEFKSNSDACDSPKGKQ